MGPGVEGSGLGPHDAVGEALDAGGEGLQALGRELVLLHDLAQAPVAAIAPGVTHAVGVDHQRVVVPARQLRRQEVKVPTLQGLSRITTL